MTAYITASEIRSWLGVDSSKYDDTFLSSLITEKMGYVNRLSNMCWNGETETVTERHDITKFKGGYYFGLLGIPIHLQHSSVKTVSSLKIFNGDEYEEWIGNKTEGRGKDYYINYQEGIIYLNRLMFWYGGEEVIVTYTYGRDDLPYYIKELTRLLVVRDLVVNERKMFALPEGYEGISFRDMLDWLNKRIGELEEMVRAIHVVRSSL
jgi:hypothetical protein